MTKLITRTALTAAALLLFAAGARADDAYEIKLQRPEKVGDKFDVAQTADVKKSTKITIDGNEFPSPTEHSVTNFTGQLTVSAVDDLGREKEFHLVVKKFQSADGDAALADVAPEGAEFDIKYDGKEATYTKKDAEISDAEKKALANLFHPPSSSKSDDEMFGTPDKKKVGDSWTPNFKAIVKDMEDSKMEMKDLAGSMKVADEKPLGDEPALTIAGSMEASDFSFPQIGKAKNGKIKMEISGQIPKDTKSQSTNSSMNMTIAGDFESASEGKTVNLSLNVSAKTTIQRTLAK